MKMCQSGVINSFSFPFQLILLLTEMYADLGLIEALQIDRKTLRRFLTAVEASYRPNPFHNFRHCFCVTQMMFTLIHGCGLDKKSYFRPRDLAVFLTAAICHDLDHPGLNNSYQVNARTALAIKYANVSPLENHHKDQAMKLLNDPETNIFGNLNEAEIEEAKADVSRLILATDMAKHNEIVARFESFVTAGFDGSDADHVNSLKCVLIKACDISNECRPISVSEDWVERLLQEYFEQSDLEKSQRLPFAPFMDRDKVTKSSAQTGFLRSTLIPFMETIRRLLPEMEDVALTNLRKSLAYYESLPNKAKN